MLFRLLATTENFPSGWKLLGITKELQLLKFLALGITSAMLIYLNGRSFVHVPICFYQVPQVMELYGMGINTKKMKTTKIGKSTKKMF